MKASRPASDEATATDSLLRADDVRFSYDGRHAPIILDGVSLNVAAGDFVGLAGPNGAGKTTLLHVLTGALVPSSGVVSLAGRNIANMRHREVAANVAVVPQRNESAFHFGVMEMVLMGRQPYLGLAAFDTAEDVRLADEALERVGAGALRNKRFDRLSGGEQQLVLIARALTQQAPVLVLDEPVAFLDLRHQFEIMQLLAELAREGRGVLATFHDLNHAARWCSRLALLSEGRVAASGAPADVLQEELLRRVYGIALSVVAGQPPAPPRVEFPQ